MGRLSLPKPYAKPPMFSPLSVMMIIGSAASLYAHILSYKLATSTTITEVYIAIPVIIQSLNLIWTEVGLNTELLTTCELNLGPKPGPLQPTFHGI